MGRAGGVQEGVTNVVVYATKSKPRRRKSNMKTQDRLLLIEDMLWIVIKYGGDMIPYSEIKKLERFKKELCNKRRRSNS